MQMISEESTFGSALWNMTYEYVSDIYFGHQDHCELCLFFFDIFDNHWSIWRLW